jgi:N-acetylglucosamine-6-sulfatase
MRHLLSAVAAVVLLAAQAAAADRPNFVFVLVDDLRYDGLGCTGHPFVKTPHTDRLAKEGVNFTTAFVTTPLCSPARSSFLTGKFVHSTGVLGNGNNNELSHRLVTFPKLLHDAGYATAYVGKWHMGNDDSPRPGFDRWVSFKGQGQYENPPLNVDGKAAVATGYMTDLLNGQAGKFVKEQKGDKPFCLYLAHKAVHGPFTPAERHKGLYTDDKYPPPPADDRSGKPAITENTAKEAPKKKAAAPKGDFGVMRSQMRCLMAIDEGVGMLLQALEESKQLDNTVFVFTSDNGYFWGDHGGLGDKRWAYEPSIRIPLLLRYPKLAKAGTAIPQMVANIDIAPTFLDLAGVKAPADVQGKSFVPLLKGDATGWRAALLTEYFKEPMYPRTPTWQSVRTEKWKLIHYPDNPAWNELYDLAADPHELKNRVKDADAAGPLKELQAELAKQLKETGAK